jgi:hypothetical protein
VRRGPRRSRRVNVYPEDRVVGRYTVEIGARALGADPREELSDFPRPPSQVRAQDLLLIGVDDLGGVKVLTPLAEQELAVARSARVSTQKRPPGMCAMPQPALRRRPQTLPVRPLRVSCGWAAALRRD